ncbi:hypothetical protein ACJX0J_016542, partial [Zea mays]
MHLMIIIWLGGAAASHWASYPRNIQCDNLRWLGELSRLHICASTLENKLSPWKICEGTGGLMLAYSISHDPFEKKHNIFTTKIFPIFFYLIVKKIMFLDHID